MEEKTPNACQLKVAKMCHEVLQQKGSATDFDCHNSRAKKKKKKIVMVTKEGTDITILVTLIYKNIYH